MNKIIFDDVAKNFTDYYDFNAVKENVINKYDSLCLYNDETVKPFEIVQKVLSVVKYEKSIKLFIEYIKEKKPVFVEVIGKNDYVLVGFEYGVDEITVIDFEC